MVQGCFCLGEFEKIEVFVKSFGAVFTGSWFYGRIVMCSSNI